FFVGAAAGGIWKTTNGGVTWSVNTDSLPTLGVSAIAVTKSNPSVMYFGSGDRDAGDAVGYGVFKSTNAGASWTISNSGMGNRTVGKLIIDPNNASTLLAACNGGIYRSTNAGASWTQVFSGGFFKDIVFKPNNSNVVYATKDGLLYRSLNNGQTWTAMTGGLPTTGVSRAVIEVNALDPKLVYFWIANGSVHKGFYLSRDSGTTFRTQSTTPNLHDYSTTGSGTGGQAWYDMDMVSDPTSAAIVYCGGVNIFKSSDTGKTWTIAGYWVNQIHADQHELEADPITKRIFAANDGGLYASRNKGTPWVPLKSGLGIAQIYKMDASRTKKDILINGYQDNGTGNYNNGWYTTYGGDGMDCAIDQTDYRYSYGELYYGSIFRVFNVNAQATIANNGYIAAGSDTINESGAWVTPITLKEGSGNTMYVGYKNIWRSNNIKSSPVTWKRISYNLGGVNNVDFRELESNIANPDILYASRSNGTFFRSDNVNATTPTWTSITQPVAGVINTIETDPRNANVVYIGIGARVYRSTNKGNSWTQVASTMSNNVAAVLLDTSNKKRGIYVSTAGGGVWYTDTTLNVWRYFSKGLPNTANVTDLEMYYEPTKKCNCSVLYGSTYNRGNFYTTIYNDGTQKPVALLESYDTVVCKSNTVSFKDKSCYAPGRFKWEFTPSSVSFVNGTDSSSSSPTISFGAVGKYAFKFMAENCNGTDTMTGTVIAGDTLKTACVTSTTNSVSGLGIFSVELSTLNRISSGRNPEGAYVNLGCTKVVKLKKGKKYTLKVLTGSTYTEQVKAFIDYNNNGTLNDAGELVYQPAANVLTHIDSFTVPTTAVTDKILRLRIRSDYISIGTNPCSTLSYGQTEDYGVYIESDNLTPKFVTDVPNRCQDQSVKFIDSTKGVGASYSWNFGSGAVPASATGKGPHSVKYTSAGYKKVTLIVDSKSYSKDSAVLIYSAPNLSISFTKGDSSVCKFKPFTLKANDANASSPGYQWRLNGVNISDSIFAVFRKSSSAYSDSGMYSVIASTTNCKDTAFQKVKVRHLPVARFTVNDSTQCFNGHSLSLTNASSITQGTYKNTWFFGDNVSDTGYSKTYVYSSYGSYTVKLRSVSNYGCVDSFTKPVQIYENTVPGFAINTSAQCFNSNSFNFTNSSTLNTGTYNSQWSFGDGSFSSLKNPPSKTYSTYFSSYKVKLVNLTDKLCKDSIEKTIILYPNPLANFSVNDSTQCVRGNTFNFTGSSSIKSGTFTSNWNFGDAQSSSLISPSHVYTLPGNYTVRLILNSNQNCKDTMDKLISVYHQPQAKFTINDSTQCLKGNALMYTQTSSIAQGTFSHTWFLGNGNTSTANTVSLTYAKDSTYWVKLKVISNNACSDSIIKPVVIFPQTLANFNINSTPQCFKANSFTFANTSALKSGTYTSNWNFGDLSGSVQTNPPAKNYSVFKDSLFVSLYTSTNNSCKDTVSKLIRLLSSPYPAFAINDSDQCENENLLSFTNQSTSNNNTLASTWYFGDNTSASTANTQHKYLNEGTYKVKLILTSNPQCKDSLTKNITIYPSPLAGINVNDSNQCLNGNLFIFSNLSVISSGTYNSSWKFGDNNSSAVTAPAHIYNAKGSYKVQLIVNSNFNCKDTAERMMEVFESPKAMFDLDDSVLCLRGNLVKMTDKSISSQAYTRTWLADMSVLNSTAFSVQHNFTDTGFKTIQLLLISNQLCRDSISKKVYIAPHPVYTINGLTTICKDETLSLNASPVSANSYQWKFDQDNFSTSSAFSRLCSSAGNFKLLVIATNTFNCIDSQWRDIVVNKLPVPVISFDGLPSSNGKGIDIKVSDVTGIPVNSRNWQFSNGSIGSNISEILVFTDSVTLTAKLTLTDTNGCTGTSALTKFFIIPNSYYLPNTFTPDGDKINDEFKLSGFIQIRNFSMRVYNRWGEQVFESNHPDKGWDGTFMGEKVPNGSFIYIVEFEDMTGTKIEKKGYIMVMR
ncbi:MAG: PKD domain-containing protein, partial [Chitinophagaceae bacterium]